MVCLEVRRLIGDQRIGCRVRFVEAVTGKARDQLEDARGVDLRHAVLHRAGDERLLLRIHLGLDLLAHRAAQEIGPAETVTREHLGDLHHLFLVDDDAEGLLENSLKARVQIVGLLEAVLARDVLRNVVHRARPIERHQRDDVLEAVGLHLAQHIAHARAFQLEHAGRFTLSQHGEGALVIEWEMSEIDLLPAGADQAAGLVEHSECLEPQKVELHEAGKLDIFH